MPACLAPIVFVLLALASAQIPAADEIPNSDMCEGILSRISFRGNRVTRPQIMLRELALQAGDECSIDRIVDGVQRLADLGLFRSVHAEIVPRATQDRPPLGAALSTDALPDDSRQGFDGIELQYVVKEKFYFIGLPRLSRTSDGEVRAGISLEWDNFLGRLHKMQLVSEWRQEDEGRGRGGFVHELDYDVPRWLSTDYGFSVRLRGESRQVDLAVDGVDYGEGRRDARAAGVTLARWLNASDGVQGLRMIFGAGVEQREYDISSGGLGPLRGGVDLHWRVGLESRRVHRDRYRRTGHRIGSSLRFASSAMGSDFDWVRLDTWMAAYRPVGQNFSNLNAKVSLGLSDNAPFGERFYSIGGGDLLRGMTKGSREGDIRLVANVEYLVPWYKRPTLRGVVFADVGNVWLRDEVDLLDLEWRGGLGIRWKLEALSNTDMRIDVAWDPDEQTLTPYISTSLTF